MGWGRAVEEALGRRAAGYSAVVVGAREGGVSEGVGLHWNNVMDEGLLPFSLLEALGEVVDLHFVLALSQLALGKFVIEIELVPFCSSFLLF